jgi:hypothetical protein
MSSPLKQSARRLLVAGLGVVALATGCARLNADWRTASHEPMGTAPDPAVTREAVVQVYAARAFGWRGFFGVHTWVAAKPANASAYTVYEVIGWRARWNDSVVAIRTRAPDARWYGSTPELLADKRGAVAEAMIPRIEAAVRSYPWAGEYTVWPGPNSNTFTAWVTRAVPELQADLPPTAIGKDYNRGVFASAPSGGGGQASLAGLLAVTASGVEGLELNVLGLTFGINPFDPSLKLPLVGRIGPERNFTN